MEDEYENIPDKYRNTVGTRTPSQNPTERQSSRRWFVVITVCLGLICVLLAIALTLMYIHLTSERDQMKMTNRIIAEEYNRALSSLKIRILSDALMKSTSGSIWYYISSEKKSWSDSRQFCRDLGGDLVIINTEEEQKFISSLVKERVWIGLSDTEKEGNMMWVDNTPLTKGFWLTVEPIDDKGIEDCVEILSPTKPFLSNWNDLECSETRKWSFSRLPPPSV